ncbi:hypothetical protein RGQ29_010860 [Quercus rubra]|uniref:SP-RING-type domain-containing protein n=1 Tax=Quercus rubra TaxID=3512 RepID=A0AAN7J7Z1_QUERU|nr:hypothetical protein RGQ29_010860 [Quercus rubra]
MAGTAVTPSPAAGSMTGLNIGANVSASFVNSFRVAAVAERLSTHVQPDFVSDDVEFFNLCLSLARGIDYAVANNEVPPKAQDLPLLLKQVCQRKNSLLLQAPIMVLMISVKNACKIGWFSKKETEELFALANELGSSFCSPGDINTGDSGFLSSVSKIMERFYPRMKMGQTLASLDVQPGYGAYVIDFHISKNTAHSPQEKIWLFVAQTDSIETSACIISPPQVNFLLNGKGVDRRTNVHVDAGPQLPTNVTHMLKYGTNLLQAVGQFNGRYVIFVAFMSVMSSPDTPVLLDYVQPAVATVDSDSDIIEGPSRISLNCPISYARIGTPVKGYSCKHLQCFDFGNFVDINSRRPSWRCPHCNQYVCYLDIRLDQNMVKVLREVGENVSEVIISADGSWKAVLESDDHVHPAREKTLKCQNEKTEQQESTSVSNSLPNVLDLTDDNDEMEVVSAGETEDRKPILASLPVTSNLTLLPDSNTTSGVNQNSSAQLEEYWSSVLNSVSTSSAWSQRVGGISEPITANLMQSPLLTDALSPVLNLEPEGHGNTNFTTSLIQSQSSPNNFQLQQSQYAHSINEYGRLPNLPFIPRHVNRTPIAVQALPAQSQTPNPQERPRSSLTPNGSLISPQVALPMAPTVEAFNTMCSDMERQQHFRAHMNPLQVSDIPSSLLQRPSVIQSRDHQDRSHASSRSHVSSPSVPPGLGHTAQSRLQSHYKATSGLLTEFQNSHLQQAFNPRMPQSVGQSSSPIPPSSHPSRTQVQQGGGQIGINHRAGTTGSQPARYLVNQNRYHPQNSRQAPSVPLLNQTSRTGQSLPVSADGLRASTGEQRGNMGGMSQAVPRADGLLDSTSEQNWRPSGRMRGSLSGRAYSEALSQFMIQPTQTAQTARPPPNSTPPASNVLPQLQALIANNRNARSPQTSNIQ